MKEQDQEHPVLGARDILLRLALFIGWLFSSIFIGAQVVRSLMSYGLEDSLSLLTGAKTLVGGMLAYLMIAGVLRALYAIISLWMREWLRGPSLWEWFVEGVTAATGR